VHPTLRAQLRYGEVSLVWNGLLMTIIKLLMPLTLALACHLAHASHARAADITGAWATRTSVCPNIFVKRKNGIAFIKGAGLHGNGFVIDGSQIRGKTATCRIKSRKEDGDVTHLIAACATDIMLSDVQFSLRTIDQNKVVRIFPGVTDLEIIYERCVLP
jgi:hypothetical protein